MGIGPGTLCEEHVGAAIEEQHDGRSLDLTPEDGVLEQPHGRHPPGRGDLHVHRVEVEPAIAGDTHDVSRIVEHGEGGGRIDDRRGDVVAYPFIVGDQQKCGQGRPG